MSADSTVAPDRKIIDIINEHTGEQPLVSLEYFPPRTEEGVQNLYKRMDRMKNTVKPAFTDVTWGAGGSTADVSLDLALYAHQTGHVSNMHLTCTNIKNFSGDPKQAVLEALNKAHAGGIRNLVALRGDPPAGESTWTATSGGFTCALDLVRFIREQFQDSFGIAVAGYPEGHPNAITEIQDPSTLTATEQARSSVFDGKTYACLDDDYKKEMDYLKEKVDAGADLIITQMFFDAAVFKTFAHDCRAWGITCPIVPGLMCINAYAGFCKMTKFCKTRVQPSLQQRMDELQHDAAAIKEFGVEFGISMCRDLLDSGLVRVLHFYTLNLERVVYGILDGLGITDNALAQADESDAFVQVAKGSAWARVGDRVKSLYGQGVVVEVFQDTGAAKIELDTWILAGGQKPTAILQKGHYTKLF